MKKKVDFYFSKPLMYFVILTIVSFIVACNISHSPYEITREPQSLYPNWDCLTSQEVDIVGTWYAGGQMRNDTLIFQGDGTYKQIIHVKNVDIPDSNYESDWLPWWIENTNSGTLIHLEAMNLCAAYQGMDNCEHAGGDEFKWGYFCDDNYDGTGVSMGGEGILVVLEPPVLIPSLHNIVLRIMDQQEFPWVYELQEP